MQLQAEDYRQYFQRDCECGARSDSVGCFQGLRGTSCSEFSEGTCVGVRQNFWGFVSFGGLDNRRTDGCLQHPCAVIPDVSLSC